MSKNYNSTLQSNNTDLEEILNTINALPEAGQDNGVGIVVSSIVNTESTADGGMNTLKFDLTDGTHVELNAKNGNTGSPGAKGDPYTLTDTDKASIAASVKNSFTTETWTFTLSDGSVITKQIVLTPEIITLYFNQVDDNGGAISHAIQIEYGSTWNDVVNAYPYLFGTGSDFVLTSDKEHYVYDKSGNYIILTQLVVPNDNYYQGPAVGWE